MAAGTVLDSHEHNRRMHQATRQPPASFAATASAARELALREESSLEGIESFNTFYCATTTPGGPFRNWLLSSGQLPLHRKSPRPQRQHRLPIHSSTQQRILSNNNSKRRAVKPLVTTTSIDYVLFPLARLYHRNVDPDDVGADHRLENVVGTPEYAGRRRNTSPLTVLVFRYQCAVESSCAMGDGNTNDVLLRPFRQGPVLPSCW